MILSQQCIVGKKFRIFPSIYFYRCEGRVGKEKNLYRKWGKVLENKPVQYTVNWPALDITIYRLSRKRVVSWRISTLSLVFHQISPYLLIFSSLPRKIPLGAVLCRKKSISFIVHFLFARKFTARVIRIRRFNYIFVNKTARFVMNLFLCVMQISNDIKRTLTVFFFFFEERNYFRSKGAVLFASRLHNWSRLYKILKKYVLIFPKINAFHRKLTYTCTQYTFN